MSIERLQQFAAEGRIIRGNWSGVDDEGRETACLYAALVPGATSPSACSADLMAQWFAEMTPFIDDNGTLEKWRSNINRYVATAPHWKDLSPDAWRRTEAKTILASLNIALPYDVCGVIAPVISFHRYFGHGGEIVMINLQAARRYAVELLEGAA